MAWRRAIPAAAAALILGGCGGGHHATPAKPQGSPAAGPAPSGSLPPDEQRAVANAQRAIAAYCAKASKSLDSPQQALPSQATVDSVESGVNTLIAIGRAHPAAMRDVLFAAESKLEAQGCYPSLGNRIDAVRQSLR